MSGTISLLPLITNQLPSMCESILDVGCGNGELASELAVEGRTVVGFDIDKGSVGEARRRFSDRTNLHFRVGDAMQLDRVVGRRRFDCIVSTFALHHVDTPSVLQLMKKHLRKNGRIIIIDLYADWKSSSAVFLLDQLLWSHFSQVRAIKSTAKDITISKVWRFLVWRMSFAASIEGRRHIKNDLSLEAPFSIDHWRHVFHTEIPGGLERILMGSVFLYSWSSSEAVRSH